MTIKIHVLDTLGDGSIEIRFHTATHLQAADSKYLSNLINQIPHSHCSEFYEKNGMKGVFTYIRVNSTRSDQIPLGVVWRKLAGDSNIEIVRRRLTRNDSDGFVSVEVQGMVYLTMRHDSGDKFIVSESTTGIRTAGASCPLPEPTQISTINRDELRRKLTGFGFGVDEIDVAVQWMADN